MRLHLGKGHLMCTTRIALLAFLASACMVPPTVVETDGCLNDEGCELPARCYFTDCRSSACFGSCVDPNLVPYCTSDADCADSLLCRFPESGEFCVRDRREESATSGDCVGWCVGGCFAAPVPVRDPETNACIVSQDLCTPPGFGGTGECNE